MSARGREWVILPEKRADVLRLRPLGGSEEDATLLYLPMEPQAPTSATFPLPDPGKSGAQAAGLLMRDALRLKLRAGAGPFRSFGNLTVEPRAYQLVPLLMALRQETVRLLIADDVGIGKTIEAGLIARELLDRGEIERLTVICPPHLCEQWQQELRDKFALEAEIVRTGTARRLERGLPAGQSIFEVYPITVVSLDYVKSERRRDEFVRACPEFVIVEEAHTSVGGTASSRHLRYTLLRELASDPERHMLLLTATPHSGDEEAFHNLLGLLDPKFKELQQLPKGAKREKLREELAEYFVQRRRPDIHEWKDSTVFPDRESAETTYLLTGDWGKLFDAILKYARHMVHRAQGKSQLEQRMNWWAALALLRCASSSPAAASMALRTRLHAIEGASEAEQMAEIERLGNETVFDGESDDELNTDETVPAGQTEGPSVDPSDAEAVNRLIQRAEALKGPKQDPKLAALLLKVEQLLADGFRPVVFCRYIATAHYVAKELSQRLPKTTTAVAAVTGELTPDEREDRVRRLSEDDDRCAPVLVATDCLSEGVNLQRDFNAVIHYDLVWNPTRHEQREGRVDRFNQPSRIVRTLMLYGENNPVDGAVLQVILRKAEKIRQELGVSVPLPADNNKVMDTIMQTVLLKTGSIEHAYAQPKLDLDFGEVDQALDTAWESAKAKTRESRHTLFAQRRLRPEDVLPEWRKATDILGSEADVERFVRTAAERLRTPLEPKRDHFLFPVRHLPTALKERLEALGIEAAFRLSFKSPAPYGADYIHRAHPLVAALADHVAEKALAGESPELGARTGAVFTDAVKSRTAVVLLRLRHQLIVEHFTGKRKGSRQHLLSEECLAIKVSHGDTLSVLSEEESQALMACAASRNMLPEQREHQLGRELERLKHLEEALKALAQQRAETLLEDHTRVRAAGRGKSEALGVRYGVKPCDPDLIGLYLFLPTPAL